MQPRSATSKNRAFKLYVCNLVSEFGGLAVEYDAVSVAKWSRFSEAIWDAISSIAPQAPLNAYISTDGKLTISTGDKLVRLNVMFNNKELGSPRPWALAKSLGYSGEGSLDEVFQRDVSALTRQFLAHHGDEGEFNTESAKALVINTTDLLQKWLSSTAFMTRTKLSEAARKWGAFGEVVLFVRDSKGLVLQVTDLSNMEQPSAMEISRVGEGKLLLSFDNGYALACRIHTDSKRWNATSKLPVKLSFELAN